MNLKIGDIVNIKNVYNINRITNIIDRTKLKDFVVCDINPLKLYPQVKFNTKNIILRISS